MTITKQFHDTTDDCAIQIQRLTKWYGSFQALHGVNLNVRRGEVFGFLGPNGAGKTTTIRCMLDLIRPSGGKVRVLGIDPQKHPTKVRSQVGYLPGELHLDDNLTSRQALRWFDSFRGSGADWHYVHELTERLDLKLDTSIKQFSKGNKQKVGVIQAFMHKPQLLMLDEPTSGLDPLMQQEVLRLVRETAARGATVFFSSHVLSEVQLIAERVAIVRKGRIVEIAPVQELMTRNVIQLKVRFLEDVDPDFFAMLADVKILSREDHRTVHLEVAGEMDALIKLLATVRVHSLETVDPDLEDVFLAYYSDT